MTHLHSVNDADIHFSINPTTREIINASAKNSLVQYDHNSERFSFDIPRYIDGHDMSLCNRVEVHFLNIGVGEREGGVYEVDDWQISPDDENIVVCSWLISANATQLAGSLNFLLRFACVTDGTIDYAWHTEIFSGITVLGGMSNSEAVVAEFPDILANWKAEVLAEFNANINEATTAAESARNSATAAGNAADRAETAANSISFHYGVCSTAAATAAKVVSIDGFELKVGAMVTVRFNATNTVANPTLNVSGTGAYPMLYKGNSVAAYPLFTIGSLEATKLYDFVFTGANYELVGGLHVDSFADTSKNRNGYVKPTANGDITWTGGVGTVNKAAKAVGDEDGNNIKETYATKSEANITEIPDYWEAYLPDKIATIKALQDEGGKDCFSFVVMTDIHYPSNLGKCSPSIAKRILDECNIKYALVLGDVRNRGLHTTKELCELEWANLATMFEPLKEHILQTQGNHDSGYGSGDYDGDGDNDTYAYEFTPAEMFNRVYRKAGMTGDAIYDASGTAYYVDDTPNKVRYILLNTQLNFNGNEGYDSYETVDGMAKYPSMWKFRYTQCQYDFLTEKALANIPDDNWSIIIGSHAPINQSDEMPEYPVMVGVLNAFQNKTTYTGEYAGTAEGGVTTGYINKAEPQPNNTTDTSIWVNGYRIGSSGVTAGSGKTVSNFIPCKSGDIVRIKGITFDSASDRYQMFGEDKSSNQGIAYITEGSGANITIAISGDEYVFTIHRATTAYIRFTFTTPTDASSVIITVNEEIKEGEIVAGYDTVSVDCDFTTAKGKLICYNAGHTHQDKVSTSCYPSGVLNFPIITTRCDAAEENDSTLKAERIKGTVTEQSFDVFTVNKAERKIYATKIGAGTDREISY